MRAFLLCLILVGLCATSGRALATNMSDVVNPGPATSEKPSVTQYWQGVDALAQGNIKQAEAAFQESLRLDPAWYAPLLGLADTAVRDGRLSDAESWIEKAEAMAPRSVEVASARGRFHVLLGEREVAEAEYKKAISLDEQAALPRLDLADLYLKDLWKPQEAVDAYRALLKISPNHAGAHYGLGLALMATGKPAEAMVEFNASISLAPKNPLPHVALGNLHVSRGEYTEAVAAYSRALNLQPDFAIVRVHRGDAFAALGDNDGAIADYQAAVKAAPKLSIAHFKLGSMYQVSRQWDKAEAAYLNAIDGDPQNAWALNNLAWLMAERNKRLDDALGWAQRAVQLAPDVIAFQDTLGWVWLVRGELGNAAEVLEKAAATDPHLADIPYHLGIVYAEQGRKSEAVAAFRKALEIDRNFANAADAESRINALSGG